MSDKEDYSLDVLEQGVLGCIVDEGNEGMALAVTEGLKAEHFTNPQVASLFNKVSERYSKGETFDEMSMCGLLPHSEIIFMNECMDKSTGASILQMPRYLEMLRDAYKKREVVKLGMKMVQSADEQLVTAEDLISYSETKLLEINSAGSSNSIITIGKSLKAAAQGIVDRIMNKAFPFISTGFQRIDDIIIGLRGGRFYVLAARPGMGKTALGWRIARNIAANHKDPKSVYMLSLEMTHIELSERLISGEILLNLMKVDQKTLGNTEQKNTIMRKIAQTVSDLENIPLTIDDHHDLTLDQIRSRVRHMVAQKKCDVVIIDYLQLIKIDDNRKRREQIGQISRGLKNMAKELDIPVVALCQLNREMEKEKRLPRMSDLRESGDIEQDADVVAMIYHNKEMSEDEIGIYFAKARGSVADQQVTMGFQKAYTLFSDDPHKEQQQSHQQTNF